MSCRANPEPSWASRPPRGWKELWTPLCPVPCGEADRGGGWRGPRVLPPPPWSHCGCSGQGGEAWGRLMECGLTGQELVSSGIWLVLSSGRRINTNPLIPLGPLQVSGTASSLPPGHCLGLEGRTGALTTPACCLLLTPPRVLLPAAPGTPARPLTPPPGPPQPGP